MSNWNSGPVRDVLAMRSDDFGRCACGCDEVELRPVCHPEAGVRVLFDHREKVLLLTCAEKDCCNLVDKVKVAEGKAVKT